VHDEVLARLAALVGVPLAGEDEGAFDQLTIDLAAALAGVLLDDGEEVAQQAALELSQCGETPGRPSRGCGLFCNWRGSAVRYGILAVWKVRSRNGLRRCPRKVSVSALDVPSSVEAYSGLSRDSTLLDVPRLWKIEPLARRSSND
jgi:hypothetical protein